MNPYKTPEANLNVEERNIPGAIYYCFGILSIAFIFTFLETWGSSVAVGSKISEPENYGFLIIWFGVLVWISSGMKSGKSNLKYTMLLLAIIVVAMGIYGFTNNIILSLNIAEALCYLAVFLILRSKDVNTWFKK